MTQIKRARRNQVNTLEKRPDRSETELRAAVVSRRLCFIWAAIVLSFPPTKHQALWDWAPLSSCYLSAPPKYIALLASPAMQFNVQPPQPRWSGIPEAVNSLRLKIHSIPAHCIHLHPLAVQRHFSPHLLFHHPHLFNLLCSTHLRPRWVVCHQQTLQHTENLAMRTEYNNIFVACLVCNHRGRCCAHHQLLLVFEINLLNKFYWAN